MGSTVDSRIRFSLQNFLRLPLAAYRFFFIDGPAVCDDLPCVTGCLLLSSFTRGSTWSNADPSTCAAAGSRRCEKFLCAAE
ncbi:hypothetical protein AGIG_G19695 [Arapaima gigas]